MKNNYFIRLKKMACLLVLCGFGFLGVAHAEEKTEVVDRIVAVVNDDIISLFELEQMLEPYLERIRVLGPPPEQKKAMLFKVREDMLTLLINQKLTEQETKRIGITVSEKEIDNTIERFKESNSHTDEDLRRFLASQNKSVGEFRKEIEEEILRSKLFSREVTSRIVITKEDITAYYDRHKDMYRGGKKYHLRNILMEIPSMGDEEQKLEVKKKMESVLKKLKAGQPFGKMAEKHSDSSSASEGGNLGVLDEDVLSPQIREAIKEMKAGEFTSVLDTDLGYQIFFIQEITDAKAKSLEEAFPEIEKELRKEIINKKFQSWLETLRKRSHIKIVK